MSYPRLFSRERTELENMVNLVHFYILILIDHICWLTNPFRSLRKMWFVRLHESETIESPLLRLPDEILLGIVSAVAALSWQGRCVRDHQRRRGTYPLTNLSRTNRHLRACALPIRFRKALLDRQCGWRADLYAMKCMQWDPKLAEHVRHLTIDVSDDGNATERITSRLASGLCDMLLELQQLQTLVIKLPVHHIGVYRRACRRRYFLLPSVRALILAPQMEWLIASCPNLRSISTDTDPRWLGGSVWIYAGTLKHYGVYPLALIAAAAYALHLEHFEAFAWWTKGALINVLRAMPNIRSLGMPGWRYSKSVGGMSNVLKGFHKLQMLYLPVARSIRFNQNGRVDGLQGQAHDQDGKLKVSGHIPESRALWASCHELIDAERPQVGG